MSKYLVYLLAICFGELVKSFGSSLKTKQTLAFLVSCIAPNLFVTAIGATELFNKKSSGLILILVVGMTYFIHPFRLPEKSRFGSTPWHDVAIWSKSKLPKDSLTFIPPVAGNPDCEIDNNITFRLLARRASSLKISDGVEAGYNRKFAYAYKDYVDDIHAFLGIQPDFSSSCAFRKKIKLAWENQSTTEILRYAAEKGASYLLLENSKITNKHPEIDQVVFRGEEYSLIRTAIDDPPPSSYLLENGDDKMKNLKP